MTDNPANRKTERHKTPPVKRVENLEVETILGRKQGNATATAGSWRMHNKYGITKKGHWKPGNASGETNRSERMEAEHRETQQNEAKTNKTKETSGEPNVMTTERRDAAKVMKSNEQKKSKLNPKGEERAGSTIQNY